jgi:hypothetical protein
MEVELLEIGRFSSAYWPAVAMSSYVREAGTTWPSSGTAL